MPCCSVSIIEKKWSACSVAQALQAVKIGVAEGNRAARPERIRRLVDAPASVTFVEAAVSYLASKPRDRTTAACIEKAGDRVQAW